MPINNRELMEAIAVLADDANIRACVKNATKGALVCGAMSLAGGILLGPPGLAIGGTLGGLTAYSMSTGKYKPIGEIIMNDLTERQQECLIQSIQAAVADVGVSDLTLLIPLLARNHDVKIIALQIVSSFVKNELGMQIID